MLDAAILADHREVGADSSDAGADALVEGERFDRVAGLAKLSEDPLAVGVRCVEDDQTAVGQECLLDRVHDLSRGQGAGTGDPA